MATIYPSAASPGDLRPEFYLLWRSSEAHMNRAGISRLEKESASVRSYPDTGGIQEEAFSAWDWALCCLRSSTRLANFSARSLK